MVRAVLDTNTLVSGLLYPCRPRKLIELAIAGKIEIVSSAMMINEMREVLARDKFGLTEEELRTMVDFAIRLGSTTIVKSNSAVVKDPDDDVVISAACDGKAAYVVSGDRYALEAKEFAGIRIVKAGETLKLMGKPQQWRYGRTILLRVGVAYSG